MKRKAYHEYKKLKRKQPAGLDVQKIYQEMQSDSDHEPLPVKKPPSTKTLPASSPKKKYSSASSKFLFCLKVGVFNKKSASEIEFMNKYLILKYKYDLVCIVALTDSFYVCFVKRISCILVQI